MNKGDPRAGMVNVEINESDELERLRKWIDDLQSGMYINCVYCGFNYGPGEEVKSSMSEALYEHIRICSKHPINEITNSIQNLINFWRGVDLRPDQFEAILDDLQRVINNEATVTHGNKSNT